MATLKPKPCYLSRSSGQWRSNFRDFPKQLRRLTEQKVKEDEREREKNATSTLAAAAAAAGIRDLHNSLFSSSSLSLLGS